MTVSVFTLSLAPWSSSPGLRGSRLPREELCSTALSSPQSFIHSAHSHHNAVGSSDLALGYTSALVSAVLFASHGKEAYKKAVN